MAISLTDKMFQGLQSATDFFTQTANSVTVVPAQDSWTNRVSRTGNAIANTTNQALDTVAQTTEKAKGTLSQITNQAVNTVTATTEQAKTSLENSLQKVESYSGATSEALQNALIAMMKNWINAHPKIVWLVSHPILTFIFVVLAILILLGLLKALAGFFETAWLAILQAPLKFSRWILVMIYQSLSWIGLSAKNKSQQPIPEAINLNPDYAQTNNAHRKQQLAESLNRLDAINQEQKKLIQEIAALLSSDEVSAN